MSLIGCIIDESNIYRAIHTLKSNKGSKTPGVNGETISDILKIKDEIVKRIKYDLKGRYTPGMVKRVEIPKGDGEFRPLGIPDIYDRLVQLCFKQVLEPIVENRFHKNSFGFRPRRSTEHAIATCYHMVNIAKLHFVVDVDIKGFFDNINHKKLTKQLKRFKSIDKKTLSIIKCMLKVEISEKKSKIVNLRKEYSVFLGIKLKAIKNRKRLTVRSYVSDKSKKAILTLIKQEVKELQKRRTAQQVYKFNSVILGIQNYYRIATMVNRDFSKIGYIVNKSLMNRLGKPSSKKDKKYKLRYKGYNFQVWNVANTTIFTLQAIKFKIPK
ncbi:MAG: reverse transcriptase domain-containing protein, partial [Fusobacteriaceae bacterium]